MANQVRFTPLPELVRLAESAKAGGCELGEVLGDTGRMYTAEFDLIRFYEAATPNAFLALVAMSRSFMEEAHRSRAKCSRLEAELSELRAQLPEVK